VGRVLAIVAEKTGYPPDMLEMDLDLEADLGVDTVKQAEVFAAVREAYGIERQENLKLRDFPTLAHVVKFVYDFAPAGAVAPAGSPVLPPVLPPQGKAGLEGSPGGPSRNAPTDLPRTTPHSSSPASTEAPRNDVVERVLQIVAEKTGYPPDMLEMDLDLEADLGVDTVKQAEVFAAVREAYGHRAPGEPEAPRLPDARSTW
jgi:acyl carrier protein